MQDFRIFNRALSVSELTGLLLKGPVNMGSLYSKWSDPSALMSFHNTANDIVNKGFVVNNAPTTIMVNGTTANALPYAPTSLKLMQGSMAANLQTNTLGPAEAAKTYVKYAINWPLLSAPSTLMIWAKMPWAALVGSSSANAATILTLSHGLNSDGDDRLRMYVTSPGGTSHQVTVDWYPNGNTSAVVSSLAFDTWYCFGVSLQNTSPWSAQLYYSNNTPVNGNIAFINGGTADQAAGGTAAAFQEILLGSQYLSGTGGFPGQIANFRVYANATSNFTMDAGGPKTSDFTVQALNKLA